MPKKLQKPSFETAQNMMPWVCPRCGSSSTVLQKKKMTYYCRRCGFEFPFVDMDKTYKEV